MLFSVPNIIVQILYAAWNPSVSCKWLGGLFCVDVDVECRVSLGNFAFLKFVFFFFFCRGWIWIIWNERSIMRMQASLIIIVWFICLTNWIKWCRFTKLNFAFFYSNHYFNVTKIDKKISRTGPEWSYNSCFPGLITTLSFATLATYSEFVPEHNALHYLNSSSIATKVLIAKALS